MPSDGTGSVCCNSKVNEYENSAIFSLAIFQKGRRTGSAPPLYLRSLGLLLLFDLEEESAVDVR
jgi:hypothetical protein